MGVTYDLMNNLSLAAYNYFLPRGTVVLGLFVLLGFNALYAMISAMVTIVEVSF